MRFSHFQGEKQFARCLLLCFHRSQRRIGVACWPRFLRSASVLPVVLLEAVPSFSALFALSAFRFSASARASEAFSTFSALFAFPFSASGRASGSVFRVLRVLLHTECFCRSARSPSLRGYRTERRPEKGASVDKGMSFLELAFLDHMFSTQIGGSFFFGSYIFGSFLFR